MKATFDFIPAYCPNCGQALTLGGPTLEDYYNGQPFTCACGLAFEKAQHQAAAPAAPAVHYWPGPQSSITECRLPLYGHKAKPIMTGDKSRVTCGNCRRALGL